MDGARPDPSALLDHLRPLVLVVDRDGTVVDARGAAAGFLGYRREDFVGRDIRRFAVADHRSALDPYVTAATPAAGTVRRPRPLPFRTRFTGIDGRDHDVDVVPDVVDGGTLLTLVPVSLSPSSTRPLDAELAGESRRVVRQRLCEELVVDDSSARIVWCFVDLDRGWPRVTAPDRDGGIRPAVQAAVDAGWRPWSEVAPVGHASIAVTDQLGVALPTSVLTVVRTWCAEDQAPYVACHPVWLASGLVGAYLAIGCIPEDGDPAFEAALDVRLRRLVDVTCLLEERWRDRDRLVRAATCDSLTGVANRDAFHDALHVVRGAGESFAVLYIDLDRFKEVNDRWGHAVGDRVLSEVAQRIVRVCRPDDVVARFGGDEFVVLVREVDAAAAQAVGDRIAAAVTERMFPDGAGPSDVTISIGVASGAGDGDVVDIADRAMLRAKRDGRNRIVLADTGAGVGSTTHT